VQWIEIHLLDLLCSVLVAYNLDTDDQNVPIIGHSTEDDHADGITGMDVCPRLKIVATTGYDGIVKIWDINNELIQEMTFNSTLKGICFANERGDILIGLQNHVL
jgi:WD40 repeat protein